MPEATDKKNRFDFIDGLKGIAILMVTFLHLAGPPENGFYIHSFIYAVQLFFVISAFSIFHSWNLKYPNDPSRVRNFYIRRILRIWPLWWLLVLFNAVRLSASLKTIFLNLTFLFGFKFFTESWELVLGGWSLFIEECFYLLFPLIVAPFIKNFKRAAIATLGLILISYVWQYASTQFPIRTEDSYVYRSPIGQFFCFTVGIGVYFLRGHVEAISLKLRRYLPLADVLVLALIGLGFLTDHRVTGLAWGILLLVCMMPESFLGRFSRNRFLQWFGIRCYSIYLLQFIVIQLVWPQMDYFKDRMPNVIAFNLIWYGLCFIAFTLVGDILYRYVERPFIQLGRRFQ